MINDPVLYEAIHRSFIDSWCQDSKLYLRVDGVLYYSTVLSAYVEHNGVFRTEMSTDATVVTTLAIEFSTRFQNAVSMPCRPGIDDDLIAAAKRGGFKHAETYHVMARDSVKTLLTNVDVITVNDVNEMDRFREVMVRAWDFVIDGKDLRAFFTTDRIIGRENVAAFMVNVNGEDVAGAVLAINSGIADIFWVGSVPEARSRGFGRLATHAASNAGFARGTQLAALQATGHVMPFYENLGWRALYEYQIWVTP